MRRATRNYRAFIALALLFPALTLAADPATVHAVASCSRSSFSSDGPPRAIPDTGEVESTITVPTQGRIHDVDVAVEIEHPFDSDLLVALSSNDGRTVTLAENVGMWGDDLAGTVFDDEAETSIISSLPPYRGALRPDQELSAWTTVSGWGRGPSAWPTSAPATRARSRPGPCS